MKDEGKTIMNIRRLSAANKTGYELRVTGYGFRLTTYDSPLTTHVA